MPVGCSKIRTCKILEKMLCSEIEPLPRPLQANSTNSPPLPLVSHWAVVYFGQFLENYNSSKFCATISHGNSNA
jgi:hypothetical protein